MEVVSFSTQLVDNITYVEKLHRLFLGLSLVMIYPLNHGYKGAMISSLSVPARPKAFGELITQYYIMLT